MAILTGRSNSETKGWMQQPDVSPYLGSRPTAVHTLCNDVSASAQRVKDRTDEVSAKQRQSEKTNTSYALLYTYRPPTYTA